MNVYLPSRDEAISALNASMGAPIVHKVSCRQVPRCAFKIAENFPLDQMTLDQRAQTLAMFPEETHVADNSRLAHNAHLLIVMSTRDDAYLEFNSLRVNIGAGPFVVYMCALGATEVRLHHAGGCVVKRRDVPADVRDVLTCCLSFECGLVYYMYSGCVSLRMPKLCLYEPKNAADVLAAFTQTPRDE